MARRVRVAAVMRASDTTSCMDSKNSRSVRRMRRITSSPSPPSATRPNETFLPSRCEPPAPPRQMKNSEPVVSVLEGGYNPPRVAEGVLAHVRALGEDL